MVYDKFTNKASIYDKYRPRYSDAFIDYLYDSVGFSNSSVIADIGAGTGILSEEFLKRDSKVICVEPNKEMLEQAKKKLLQYKKFSCVNSPAENTTLKSSSIDAITVGQAFHWFDKKAFLKECKRILVDNGVIVLAWNVSNSEAPINIEVSNLNFKYGKGYKGFNKRDKEDNSEYLDFFLSMECINFANDLLLNKDEFVGRCLSRSYTPNPYDKGYEEYVAQLSYVFDTYSNKDKVKIRNNTKCIIGRVK